MWSAILTRAMKSSFYPHFKALTFVGVLLITLALPTQAIENPDADADENHTHIKKRGHHVDIDNEDFKQAANIAWIGLGGAPVSEILAKHLGLEQGVGLTIHHVMEGAPGSTVGIKQHDILVEFDGQKIGDFETLRNAVRAKKPGDEVTVAFVQGGELIKKKVVLAERQLPQGHDGLVRPDQENNPLWQGLGDLPKHDHDRMRELMKHRLEELERRLQEDGAIQFDMKELLDRELENRHDDFDGDAPAPGNDKRMFNFKSQSSMTVMDEEGSVTIKVTGSHHEVIVKDKQGEILFEGPYETAKDKAAVPDDVRGRIDNIDFFKNMKNGFRFKVMPQAGELDLNPDEEE